MGAAMIVRTLTFIFMCLWGLGKSEAQSVDRLRSAPPVIRSSWDDLLDGVNSSADWQVRKAELKSRFLALIRDDQKPVKPDPDLQVHQVVEVDGLYLRKLVSYQVEADERAHAYIGIPLSPKRPLPGVVALHGTYEKGKNRVAGLVDNPMKAYLDHLCRRGYAVIAPDHFVAGHRVPPEGPYDTSRFHRKHPEWTAVGKFTYEHSIAVDILSSLPEVDPARIGALGHSLGGHGTLFLAAYDERIRVSAGNCSGTFFRHNPAVDQWSRDRWYVYFKPIRERLLQGKLPNIDFHEITSLIAPRGFMDLAGLNDGNPLVQRQRALMNLKIMDAYELEGVPENFAFYMHGRGHSIEHESRELIYGWLDRFLKEEAATQVHLLPEAAATEASIIDIGSRRELFVDETLVAHRVGIDLRLEKPVDRGSVLVFDKPWEGPFCGYGTVIHEEGRYRMYYRGLPSAGKDGSNVEVTCYAESDDGIQWRKPELGLFAIHGSKANNVILAEAAPASHNFSPFFDQNPQVEPNARFKALGGIASSGLHAFRSEDGIHWERFSEAPVFRPEGWVLDSQNVSFWSESESKYVLYFRSAVEGVRAIARTESADFQNWTEPEPMIYGDTLTARPSCHLYTNQTHPYFRAPHIYIATAARFMPGRQVLTESEAAAIQVHPKYFKDTSDCVLMTSRDGLRYDRFFDSALIKPGVGAENWVSRSNYPMLNLVETGTAEMSLYVNQDYGQPSAHVRRYSFRTDGLACIEAPLSGGRLLTKPLVFAGERLSLNMATSAAGSVRIGLLTKEGYAIPGFEVARCRALIGNELERGVRWEGDPSLASLAGQPVRLEFHLVDAQVYSFQFAPRD